MYIFCHHKVAKYHRLFALLPFHMFYTWMNLFSLHSKQLSVGLYCPHQASIDICKTFAQCIILCINMNRSMVRKTK